MGGILRVCLLHTLSLSMSQCNAVGMASGTTTYTHDPADSIRVQDPRRETLHAPHTSSDTCHELSHAECVQQAKLSSDHVTHSQDGEPCGVSLPVRGINAGRSRRSITAPKHISAYHMEAIRIERQPRTYELLPPANAWVVLVGLCMGGCGETGVEEDHVGLVYAHLAPGFIGYSELLQYPAIVQQQRVL